MELQRSVVAILNAKNKIIGTGFVAEKSLILTCAQVVELATAGFRNFRLIDYLSFLPSHLWFWVCVTTNRCTHLVNEIM
jgi:hypothetical protein